MRHKEEGESFLADNKKQPGVVETTSGLQYRVLVQGTGSRPPSPRSVVEVHYEGRLINGKVFDSSYRRNETIEFPLDGVIAGWTEGVQLMPVGSKYEFYIPYRLAYGERGTPGGPIPPFATLIFVVELISFS
jgi:FKBP-type peptidyl-prolyl cis-trans isomerase